MDSNKDAEDNFTLYLDPSAPIEARVEDLLKRMTLDEKCSLCVGKSFWKTRPVKRLSIPSLGLTDGPHGVGPHSSGWKRNTYFPTLICMGATFNRQLAKQFGTALAEETRACGKHQILGPGMNIQRSPACGRTFEYLSEDPYLNKELAKEIIAGIQSRRIAACAKHFIVNNQETRRFGVNVNVSKRALHEIYFPAFKAAVEEGGVWSVMACYNRINGKLGSEHQHILKDILMDEWGFRGYVVSDWFATKGTSGTSDVVNAGLTLEMPGGILGIKRLKKKKIRAAIERGEVSESTLDENIKRLLRVMFLVGLFDDESSIPPGSRNTPEHVALSRKIAEEGMVLLKNNDSTLPLNVDEMKTIAITGPNAGKKKGMWGGSSEVWPPFEITPRDGITSRVKDKLRVVSDVQQADAVIYVGGLGHKSGQDAEGSDKKSLELPKDQASEILETVRANPRTIVVLVSGSPVAMDDWIDQVPAVIEAWYGGMEAGSVIAGIIFGDVNPSGKLPITFPKKLSDSPAHASERTFPGILTKRRFWQRISNKPTKPVDNVYYDEGIFVGYRHFDTRCIEPLFPFGHGLSYSTFSYGPVTMKRKNSEGKARMEVFITITNDGIVKGSETVQLYVTDVESSESRPEKELKGFHKVHLEPGEGETIRFNLLGEDFSFFSEKQGKWILEPGEFSIKIGASSRDIRQEKRVTILDTQLHVK